MYKYITSRIFLLLLVHITIYYPQILCIYSNLHFYMLLYTTLPILFYTNYIGYGVIGGVMVFNLAAIHQLGTTFIDEIVPYIRKYQNEYDEHGSKLSNLSDNSDNSDNSEEHKNKKKNKWMAKLNDQDLFNVYFIYKPYALYILPCEWNVQFHARLNTFISCAADTIKPILTDRTDGPYKPGNVSASLVPLNCQSSLKKHVFVCTEPAKILHYMAQTYKVYSDVLQYYPNYWDMYVKLSWNDVFGIY